MVDNLANFLYGLLILAYVILSVFIAYHLYRYSVNQAASMVITAVFIVVSVILFAVNIALFWSLSFSELIDALAF